MHFQRGRIVETFPLNHEFATKYQLHTRTPISKLVILVDCRVSFFFANKKEISAKRWNKDNVLVNIVSEMGLASD